jgi:hypothetical protein
MTAGRVPDLASLGDIDAGTLRVAFPGWPTFHDTDDTWWALRAGQERQEGPESLLSRTLRAASQLALAEKLCLQEWLDELDWEQLAAVYRDMELRGAARARRPGSARPIPANRPAPPAPMPTVRHRVRGPSG